MACGSCGSKGSMTLRQIVVQDGSSLPTLKYLHCKHKDQFERLFAEIGINASEANLVSLATAHDSGIDKSGQIKDAKGNPIYFSVEDILRRIDTSVISNNACSLT